MFTTYLRTAWRNLVKNKLYGTINIAGLAVGMTVSFLLLPATFLFTLLLSLLICLAAVSWQTMKAASTNPVDSLKCP